MHLRDNSLPHSHSKLGARKDVDTAFGYFGVVSEVSLPLFD